MSTTYEEAVRDVSLVGKTAIVTGANTGIGKETARELARKGARVILACRSMERGEKARDEIVKDTNNENVVVKMIDLSSLQSIRQFAAAINTCSLSGEERLDILVNNAALGSEKLQQSEDGLELVLGTNHLGHFLLTNLLLDKLKASAPSRVVVVSSLGHMNYPVDLADVQASKKAYGGAAFYGRSKTANIMFAVHLAKLLEGTGVTCNSLHPGVVKTDLARNTPRWKVMIFLCYLRCILCQPYLEADEGAKTSLYCCMAPQLEGVSGQYFSDCAQKAAKSHATDPERCEELWNLSCQLVGLN